MLRVVDLVDFQVFKLVSVESISWALVFDNAFIENAHIGDNTLVDVFNLLLDVCDNQALNVSDEEDTTHKLVVELQLFIIVTMCDDTIADILWTTARKKRIRACDRHSGID